MSAQSALDNGFRDLAKVIALHPRLTALKDKFLAEDKAVKRSLGESVPFELISHGNRAILERVCKTNQVLLPVYGSNSCGKSTLLNALLGARLMPTGSGHVTGRVCMMQHAPLAQARIEFHSLNTVSGGTPIKTEACPNMALEEIAAKLLQILSRAHAPEGQSEFANWVGMVVKVLWPFPLLQTGVILIDLPGRSTTDDKAIQKQVRDFFQVVNPPGVVLLYSNPTFSDAEVSAYEFLLESLPTKDPEQRPSIFLCSSYLDIKTVLFDADEYELDEKMLTQVLNRRYSFVSNRNLPLLKFPPSVYDCNNFACTNALEYLTTPADDPLFGPVQTVFAEFVRKLDKWTVSLQRRRYVTACMKVALGCEAMLQSIVDIHSGRVEVIPKEIKDAHALVEEFVGSVKTLITPLIKSIPKLIEQRAQDDKFIMLARKSGSELNLGVYEGAQGQGIEMEALGAFKERFSSFLRNHLWIPILESVRDQISVKINESVEAFRAQNSANVCLALAIQATVVSNDAFTFEAPTNAIAVSMTSTLTKAFKAWLKDWTGKQAGPVINAAWKQSTVDHILSHLQSDIMKEDSMLDAVLIHVRAYSESVQHELNRIAAHAKAMDHCKATLAKNGMEAKTAEAFRRVAIPALALLHSIKEEPPIALLPETWGTPVSRWFSDFDVYRVGQLYYKRVSTRADKYYDEFFAASGMHSNHVSVHLPVPSHIWFLPAGLTSSAASSSSSSSSSSSPLKLSASIEISSGAFGHHKTSGTETMVGSSARHIHTDSDGDASIPPSDEYLLVYDHSALEGLSVCSETRVTPEQLNMIALATARVLARFHKRGLLFGSLSSYSIYVPKVLTSTGPFSASSFLQQIRVSPLGVPLVASNFRSQYPSHPRSPSDEMQAFVAVIQEIADSSTSAAECERLLTMLRTCQTAAAVVDNLKNLA